MPVFRVEKNGNYTVMSNYHLDDDRLSLKAVGLLSKMLRLPDDWDYTIAGLTALCKDGKAAVQTALKELETAGYIQRSQSHGDNGAFAGYDYIVFERPPDTPYTENRYTAESPEKQPLTDFPYTENPSTENQPQPSTNTTKYIPPIVPQRGKACGKKRRNEPKDTTDWKPVRFEGFWEFYPIHTSRQAAIKAWDRLKPSDALIDVIAIALKRQKESEQWKRGIGIPYASTYLNGQRWTDGADELPDIPGSSDEDGDVLRI